MGDNENYLTVESWYRDIQMKGNSLAKIPENERTLEMCLVAIHYWGAALRYVPDKYKTYEFCLDAIMHNTPYDERCSALAFVPEELKTHELCLEAIRHDFINPAMESCGFVLLGYTAAFNFVPAKLRTPELCYEAIINDPNSPPGYFNFVDIKFDSELFTASYVQPQSIKDILDSPELFIESLKRVGMPDEYREDALKYLEELKKNSLRK